MSSNLTGVDAQNFAFFCMLRVATTEKITNLQFVCELISRMSRKRRWKMLILAHEVEMVEWANPLFSNSISFSFSFFWPFLFWLSLAFRAQVAARLSVSLGWRFPVKARSTSRRALISTDHLQPPSLLHILYLAGLWPASLLKR